MLGAFVALDLFLFFFWEVMLVPMHFNRYLGRSTTAICGDKVLHFYNGRFTANVGSYRLCCLANRWLWNFALEAALSRSYEPEKAKYLSMLSPYVYQGSAFSVHTWLPDAIPKHLRLVRSFSRST